MDKVIGVLVAVLIVGGAFSGMLRSWQRRTQRDATISVNRELPDAVVRWRGRVQYVASARSGEPLNRLAVPGLGFRGFAELTVSDAGVLIAVDGESPVSIPVDALRDCRTTAWAIDRGVGQDGLLCLTWESADAEPTRIDTSIRISDSAESRAAQTAITGLLPHTLHTSERS